LTNNGEGFHTYAGWGATASVYAQSVAGRNGATVTGAPVTISQLPAPPAPTSYSVSMSQCALSHSWAHAGGRRIDGVQLYVDHNGSADSAWYNASTFSAAYQPWNTSTIGGGTVSCFCRTYGPGGYSAWATVTGTMPSPVTTSSYRFGGGLLRVVTSGINPAVQVHTTRNGGSWGLAATFPAGSGEVYDPASGGWARDRQYYGMLLRPINQANGWTGRDQWLGWAMKLPNPFNISPIDSQTWRGTGWRSEQDQDWQGASEHGTNAAFFFYGDQFYELLCTSVVGYDFVTSAAYIALHRENAGGFGQPVSPQLMLHRAGRIGEDINWGGNYASTGLARGQLAWVPVPPDWIWYLKERYDGWKGIGLYYPNTGLLSYIEYVSAEYMFIKAWNYGTIESGTLWLDSVSIHHSG
jgi:hypothetical protein